MMNMFLAALGTVLIALFVDASGIHGFIMFYLILIHLDIVDLKSDPR